MKGIEKLIKNNYKLVVGVLIGLVLSIGSVYAVEKVSMIDSDEVDYDTSKSHGDHDNVQETIDELYMKVGFTGDKWKDPILDGADPVLGNKLIPVVISSKGDTYYANEYTEWYNYGQKRWANAVILVDGTDTNYAAGDKINESDIESYFVWIPRYKYKIWDLGDYKELIQATSLTNAKDGNALHLLAGDSHLIDIVFGDKDKVKADSGTTKKGGASGNKEGISVGDYIVHPAFTLGNTELNGFWIGKFETGYKDANSASDAQKTEKDKSKIIVKPDVYSWRYNTVKNMLESAYEYKTELKSHMLKNTEWGAVAYLSHSAYGIGGEININNNSDYKTGYSAAPGTDQGKYPGDYGTETSKTQPWNTPTGFLASTTGNITGVYDMSGGAWEYVAAYIKGNTGSSGFNGSSDLTTTYKDYVDVYDSTSSANSYDKRILGDATGELGPFLNYAEDNGTAYYHSSWYADHSYFVDASNPWFGRGGHWHNGVLAGQFNFDGYTGGAHANDGFRLALAI